MVSRTDRPGMTIAVSWDIKQHNKQRPDMLPGLIWFQTNCSGHQQTTKVAASMEKVKGVKINLFIVVLFSDVWGEKEQVSSCVRTGLEEGSLL